MGRAKYGNLCVYNPEYDMGISLSYQRSDNNILKNHTISVEEYPRRKKSSLEQDRS